MTMYATTPKGYRAITSADEAVAGETVVTDLPQTLVDALAATDATRRNVLASLSSEADVAIDNLRAYRALATPTNTQTIAVVRLLCRVALVLIRLQVAKLDATG